MELKGWFARFNMLFEWIMRLAYLNFLWFIFTLAGLLIFGIFPATASMFSIARQWVFGNTDTPIFQSFWQTYRKKFVQTNIVGVILFIIGLFISFDFWFFTRSDLFIFKVLSIFMLLMMIIYFGVLLYIFPIYVHYRLKTLDYIRYSLIYSVGRPLNTILMIVGFITILAILYMVPGLIPVFSGSGLSLLLMSIVKRTLPD